MAVVPSSLVSPSVVPSSLVFPSKRLWYLNLLSLSERLWYLRLWSLHLWYLHLWSLHLWYFHLLSLFLNGCGTFVSGLSIYGTFISGLSISGTFISCLSFWTAVVPSLKEPVGEPRCSLQEHSFVKCEPGCVNSCGIQALACIRLHTTALDSLWSEKLCVLHGNTSVVALV
jgi:hypothetical protein